MLSEHEIDNEEWDYLSTNGNLEFYSRVLDSNTLDGI